MPDVIFCPLDYFFKLLLFMYVIIASISLYLLATRPITIRLPSVLTRAWHVLLIVLLYC